jgi:hypothetical protein
MVLSLSEAVVKSFFIIIIILLQFGVHPVAIELTLVQTRKVSKKKGTIQNKIHTINTVHTVQIQTYKVIKEHVLVFVLLHSCW